MKTYLITLIRQILAFLTMPFLIIRTACALILQARAELDAKLAALDNPNHQLSLWEEV